MGASAAMQSSAQLPTVFDLVALRAQDIARRLRPLLGMSTLAHYASLVETLYWYAQNNDARYIAKAHTPGLAPGLRDELSRFGAGERNHHVLARRDLEALGYRPGPQPPPAVRDMHAFVDTCSVSELLGHSCCVESMAAELQGDIVDMAARLQIQDKGFSFIALHLDEDIGGDDREGHGEARRRVAAEYLAEHEWLAFTHGIFEGSTRWVRMMTQALQTPIYQF